MAETHRFTLVKPARLLFSSVTVKSAPRSVQGAVPKFSGTFGIEKEDFDAIVEIMVRAIKAELGSFTNPGDYYLACMSGTTAGKRAIEKAEFDCSTPGMSEDDKFKLREKAQKRAELYKPYAGILTASSQYDVELARLEAGKVIDIPERTARSRAGRERPVLPRRLCRSGRRRSQGVPAQDARREGRRDGLPPERASTSARARSSRERVALATTRCSALTPAIRPSIRPRNAPDNKAMADEEIPF
jgi:hypothetical protein